MVNNDNGFPIIAMSYKTAMPNMSEGAIIGITFGWIIGVIGLYVLGMCLIRHFFKWRARHAHRRG